jgi:hypothetical protein
MDLDRWETIKKLFPDAATVQLTFEKAEPDLKPEPCPLLCDCPECLERVRLGNQVRSRHALLSCEECGDSYSDGDAPYIILSKYPASTRSLAVCSLDCLKGVVDWAHDFASHGKECPHR